MGKVDFPKAPVTPPAAAEQEGTDAFILQSFAKIDKVALGISFGSRLGPLISLATVSCYAAIFLTTLSLLYLEVFSVRIIAIVLNDNVVFYLD